MTEPLTVGLDVGATKTLGVALGPDGSVLAQERVATEPGREGVIATTAGVVETLRRATGYARPTMVGLGMPGLVDAGRGAVRHAVNLGVDGDWFPVGDMLADRIGVPVAVENDVNVAALGARALSASDDLVYLAIGTGLAAGLVLDGVLRRGGHGAAGEIGHVPVDPEGARCGCGQRGCLETVASGSALAAAWPSQGVASAQSVFAAAEDGDVRAVSVRDRFAGGVAEAVRLLALAVDPDTIVLGGGVSHLGEPLRVHVAAALAAQAASSPFLASLDLSRRLSVVPAGYPIAAIGAAMLDLPKPAEAP
ncbi:MAG: ROK family protein [Nocardioides sp.]|nr:ROK family protein [Nocardioides sp.]